MRGSLAGAKLHFEDSTGKFKGRLNKAVSKFHGEDNTEAFAHSIAQRHPGMSLNDVQRKAQRMNHLNNAGRKLQGAARVAGAGAAMAGAGLAFAARAAKSAPLRNVAARGAKVAAKAAVTGALFSNPITAPLGLIAAGKLATDRDAWHGAAQVGKGIAHAGGKGLQLGHVMAMGEPVVRFPHRPVRIMEPVVRCRLRMGRRPKRFQLPMERNRLPEWERTKRSIRYVRE